MDIADFFNPTTFTSDIGLDGAQLALDATLKTAVIKSIFTWRRAKPDDVLPDPASNDRKGWWGDWYSDDAIAAFQANGVLPTPTDRIGSRMWLLGREKVLPSVLARMQEYLEEAFEWMIEDGVAKSVDILTEVSGPGMAGYRITITKPNGTSDNFQFSYAWQQPAAAAPPIPVFVLSDESGDIFVTDAGFQIQI